MNGPSQDKNADTAQFYEALDADSTCMLSALGTGQLCRAEPYDLIFSPTCPSLLAKKHIFCSQVQILIVPCQIT